MSCPSSSIKSQKIGSKLQAKQPLDSSHKVSKPSGHGLSGERPANSKISSYSKIGSLNQSISQAQ